jgi:hypothetical protein
MSRPSQSSRKIDRPTKILLILGAPILVLWLIAYLLMSGVYRLLLTLSVWTFWCSRGRDVLLVYSDSPTWQEYVEENILTRLSSRAVVLNWSKRAEWRTSLATRVFYSVGGSKEFNPLVIVFRPLRSTKVFRLWQPFQDKKHAKPARLEKVVQELFEGKRPLA